MPMIMQILKHDLADLRNDMARDYRRMRKENPEKARMLFRRMRRAVALTERSMLENAFKHGTGSLAELFDGS
jgi:hypothetical protein